MGTVMQVVLNVLDFALDPQSASNVSNYSLLLANPNGPIVIAGAHYVDESSFIASAAFTSTTKRVFTSDPYTGTITLTGAAPSGGVVVTLTSSNTNAATVPTSVTVPANATTASFTVTTKTVTAATSVTITGSYSGVSKTAALTVTQ